MKNLLYLIVMTAIILTACSKDSMPKGLQSGVATYTMDISPSPNNYYKQDLETTSVSYSVSDGRIILNNSEDFKIFMWGLESKDVSEWKNAIQFDSYKLEGNTDGMDEFEESSELFAALNPAGIIQIEPYIFKFNVKEEKLLVVESAIPGALEELQLASTPTATIKEFSFEDDVWYLLENNLLSEEDFSEANNVGESGKICNEKRAKNILLREETLVCDGDLYNWHQVTCVLRYRRLGIWEKCRATLYNNKYNVFTQSNEDLTDFHIFGGAVDYNLKERCGPRDQGIRYIPAITTDYYQIVVRSDKKPLARNQNSLKMSIVFKYLCAPTDPPLQHTIVINSF